MESELPQPTYRLDTPASGWWKAPAAIGTDPAFLRVTASQRLGAVGLYIAAIGWCLVHNSKAGWVPLAAVEGGQVVSGDREQLRDTASSLVDAGIWASAELDGLEGFVVAGAANAVAERFARQESARRAGQTSAQTKGTRTDGQRFGTGRPSRPNPDKFVDWSKVSEEL